MGHILEPTPIKLISSMIYRDAEDLVVVEKELVGRFGPFEAPTVTLPFDCTDYYYSEFGEPLYRKLVCFRDKAGPDGIHRIKIMTNGIEIMQGEEGKRKVNIDPGYLTEAKLVLLTTKDHVHRIHLSGGIFAEVTLFYKDGSYRAWPWTYPDYSTDEIIQFFNRARNMI